MPQFPIAANKQYTHLEGSDALIITYGRISGQAYAARELLRSEQISCGLLKLTAVYPIAPEILQIAKQYDRILFAEEGSRAGGIGEKLAAMLLDADYKGKFRCLAIDGFVQQAPVESSLQQRGFSAEGIAARVKELLQ